MPGSPLLEVTDLRIEFDTARGPVQVVRGLSLFVEEGETLAIVGESGSGKSLSALALMALVPTRSRVTGGEITFGGSNLSQLDLRGWQRIRGKEISMIFQDPLSSLNPSFSVGFQISEMFRRRAGLSRAESRRKAIESMVDVGIPDAESRVDDYPHQFSGGMRQRIMIAIALALKPRLVIADEPTTALDVTVQAQVLRLLSEMQRRSGMALIMISHDLGVVAKVADRIAVMYAGRIVETGSTAQICGSPAHPYTSGLIGSLPTVGQEGQDLTPISGQPPDPGDLPAGCSFSPRCPLVRDLCRSQEPELIDLGDGRQSACHFAEEVLSHA